MDYDDFMAGLADSMTSMVGKQTHALILARLYVIEEMRKYLSQDVENLLQDQLLVCIQADFGPGDLIADLGNGQLGALLHDHNEQQALPIARLLRNALRHLASHRHGRTGTMQATISLLTFNHPDCDARKLLTLGEDALDDEHQTASDDITILRLHGSL
jgi:GGDEF domain-containing protein